MSVIQPRWNWLSRDPPRKTTAPTAPRCAPCAAASPRPTTSTSASGLATAAEPFSGEVYRVATLWSATPESYRVPNAKVPASVQWPSARGNDAAGVASPPASRPEWTLTECSRRSRRGRASRGPSKRGRERPSRTSWPRGRRRDSPLCASGNLGSIRRGKRYRRGPGRTSTPSRSRKRENGRSPPTIRRTKPTKPIRRRWRRSRSRSPLR